MNILELLGISYFNFLMWLAFGFIVGIAAHFKDHRKAKGGILMTVFFAAGGSIAGGYLASFLLAKQMLAFSIEGLITALFCALILAVFYRSSFRNNGHILIKNK